MNKVKWGILGTANIARWGMIPGMNQADNCQLYAIAGRSAEKARRFQEEYGFEKAYGSYDELLSDELVQAVYVPLPNDIHCEWVKKALKAGKHVLCEKPLAMNTAQVTEMFEKARQEGRILMEAYAYLHSPYVKSLQETIANGEIGEVDYIDTAFVTQGYHEDFRLHKEQGGGAMYDLGCYCTTMILSLIESVPKQVKACATFTDLGVDEMTSALITFENQVSASFHVGMALGKNTNSRYDRLYIHGSRGSIRSDVEYNQEGTVSYQVFTESGIRKKTVEVPNNYALEVEQLGRCILEGEKPHISDAFSIRNAQLIDSVFSEITP